MQNFVELIWNYPIVILIFKFDTINFNYHDIDNKIGILHITTIYEYTENANARKLAATTRNQINPHSFSLIRPGIIVYISPLNSV